jgi:hypothetical protein
MSEELFVLLIILHLAFASCISQSLLAASKQFRSKVLQDLYNCPVLLCQRFLTKNLVSQFGCSKRSVPVKL